MARFDVAAFDQSSLILYVYPYESAAWRREYRIAGKDAFQVERSNVLQAHRFSGSIKTRPVRRNHFSR